MRSRVCCLTIGLLVVLGTGTGKASLVRYRTVFEKESKKIEAQHRADEKKARDDYIRYLQSAITHMEKKGDDFGVRPAKAEMVRFKTEKTVPERAALGTPELIDRGQGYYRAALQQAKTRERDAMKTLAAGYTQRLRSLGDTGGQAVAAEIRRVAQWLEGDAGSPGPVGGGGEADATGSLPDMPGGLLAAYVLDTRKAEVPNLVRRNAPAVVKRAKWTSYAGRSCVRFEHEMATLKVPELRLRSSWTMAANVSFLPVRGEKLRILVSHGFRRHHVVVDEVGELGVYDGDFQGSGYSAKDLRGWHCLVVVASGGRTAFFVDGEAVGIARAACSRPINVIGNQGTGRQQWGGSVAELYVWSRALSSKEMAKVCEQLARK